MNAVASKKNSRLEPQILLDRLRAVRKSAGAKAESFFEAAKYCPAPWSANLTEISDTFMFFGYELDEALSELEAFFHDGDSHILNDIKRP